MKNFLLILLALIALILIILGISADTLPPTLSGIGFLIVAFMLLPQNLIDRYK
ncbi:MAG: hypothetical protein R6U64_10690 [Bacteroidales bacterium]